MPEGAFLILFIAAERLVELAIARRNTARLRAAGGIEFGSRHYPILVAFHGTWLAALWLIGRQHEVDRLMLIVFAILQAARFWILATLAQRWTTRIIILPGTPLVSRGPYGLMKHPNYAIVVLEIAIVPLALGLPLLAGIFTVLHAPLLYWRVRTENAAIEYVIRSHA